MAFDFPDPLTTDTVTYQPSFEELRENSQELETTTEFGSASYISEYKSRSADLTKDAVTHSIADTDLAQVWAAIASIEETSFVCIDRKLGRGENAVVCRYYVPETYSRIALSWAKLLEPVEGSPEPDFVTVQVPDWEETLVRVFPEEKVTVVLGSDYTGEAKMSFLRLWMYHAKKEDGLGLHAGSKRIVLQEEGERRTVGQLFLGLSATGKSTLTGHGLWLDQPEFAELLQDDIVTLHPDGSAAGSEGGGLYIKTDSLEPDEQPELFNAVAQPGAVLENVKVDNDGTVDFADTSITSNGRATILREDLESAADDIDLDHVDQIFFITRNPLMPPVARLDPDQAAAAFMLGESIQTSAGDPANAGKPIRVVGTNPFIIGSKAEEGNRFHELVADNDIDCFILNTGTLGDERKPIGVQHSVAIITAIARGAVDWQEDETTGLTLPVSVPGIDIDDFYLPDHVEDFDTAYEQLREERQAHIEQFDELKDDIVDAVY